MTFETTNYLVEKFKVELTDALIMLSKKLTELNVSKEEILREIKEIQGQLKDADSNLILSLILKDPTEFQVEIGYMNPLIPGKVYIKRLTKKLSMSFYTEEEEEFLYEDYTQMEESFHCVSIEISKGRVNISFYGDYKMFLNFITENKIKLNFDDATDDIVYCTKQVHSDMQNLKASLGYPTKYRVSKYPKW